jgi:hypothetical protein
VPHAILLQTASKAGTTGGTFADTLVANGLGNSLSIANFTNGGARVLYAWGIDSDSVAELAWTNTRIESIHDQQYGLRYNIASLYPGGAGTVAAHMLIQPPYQIPVYSGDPQTLTVTTSASDDILVSFLLEYDDLPGTQGRFASWAQISSMISTRINLRVAPVASGTAGAYGAARALNADDTRLSGARYYAICGATMQTPVTTIALQANAWGNNLIGFPAGVSNLDQTMWFVNLSQQLNAPMIPIINGYDAANVFLYVADGEASTSPKVDLVMYELTGNPLP